MKSYLTNFDESFVKSERAQLKMALAMKSYLRNLTSSKFSVQVLSQEVFSREKVQYYNLYKRWNPISQLKMRKLEI